MPTLTFSLRDVDWQGEYYKETAELTLQTSPSTMI